MRSSLTNSAPTAPSCGAIDASTARSATESSRALGPANSITTGGFQTGNQVQWNVGTLTSGQTGQVQFQVAVSPYVPNGTLISNQANARIQLCGLPLAHSVIDNVSEGDRRALAKLPHRGPTRDWSRVRNYSVGGNLSGNNSR